MADWRWSKWNPRNWEWDSIRDTGSGCGCLAVLIGAAIWVGVASSGGPTPPPDPAKDLASTASGTWESFAGKSVLTLDDEKMVASFDLRHQGTWSTTADQIRISIAGDKPLFGTYTLVERSPLYILAPSPVESAKLEDCFFQFYEDDYGYREEY